MTETIDAATGEITEHEPGKVTDNPWEFINRIPLKGEVLDLLATLGEQWGVKPDGFAEYVQAITQPQKVFDIHAPKGAPDLYQWVGKLYMSVAGRVQMLNKAVDVNGWTRVEFVPEKQTATGSAGLLTPLDGKAVYRVHLKIWGKDGAKLGSRPGMASRTGSNLFEKVETAAHGRAIANWGIGVLPGSGVASLDEMQTAQRGPEADQPDDAPQQKAPDRDSLRAIVAGLSNDVRIGRNMTDEQATQKEREWLVSRGGLNDLTVWDEEGQRIRWQDVPTQVLAQMKMALEATLQQDKAGHALG